MCEKVSNRGTKKYLKVFLKWAIPKQKQKQKEDVDIGAGINSVK